MERRSRACANGKMFKSPLVSVPNHPCSEVKQGSVLSPSFFHSFIDKCSLRIYTVTSQLSDLLSITADVGLKLNYHNWTSFTDPTCTRFRSHLGTALQKRQGVWVLNGKVISLPEIILKARRALFDLYSSYSRESFTENSTSVKIIKNEIKM